VDPDRRLASVTAVVLTHMRPRLASRLTRSLIEVEGLLPRQVVVVVNGVGGLDDPRLSESVRMVRLARNLGPAGGFRAGIEEAFSDTTTRWAYLCEDDVGLFSLPTPRLADVLARLERLPGEGRGVGAVVAYGRSFAGRGAHTENVVPSETRPSDFEPVDVACWGATLLSREAFERGVLPDPKWFFGLEDFDFFCRLREAGMSVLVDGRAARSVAPEQTSDGREEALGSSRPTDPDEPWRAYYHARNSFELIRRHGRPSWYAWQLVYAARWLQLARSRAEREAIVRGMWDGVLRRHGENPRYSRRVGEFARPEVEGVEEGVSPTR
jgi:hypothetical protein